MNKKIGLYVFGIATLLGLFAGANTVSANSAVPTCNSATLYGTVTPNGATTSAWFEWGPTTAMQWKTSTQTGFTSTSSFSQVLSPLNENATYYWRAMASNANGTATGGMMSFVTPSCGTTTPPPPTQIAPTVTIWADQTNVAYASATTLHWTSANNPQTCTGSGGNGVSGWAGMQNVNGAFNTSILTQTTTFTISCTNTAGTSSNYVTIYVGTQPVQTCQDSSATNYRTGYPCQYPQPVQTCQDPSALNYRGTIPCTYPTPTCQDPSALNYRVSLPCAYPQPVQTCQDPSALNYRGTIPCTYPQPIQYCNDPSAINYRGTLPCTYPQPVQVCQDSSALNYHGTLPCQYPQQVQVCLDTTALNYRGTLPCQYPQQVQVCNDSSAINYRGALPCRYFTDNIRPTVSLYADDTTVNFNRSTVIRWSSTNASSCNATGGTNGWSGYRNTSGSFNTGILDSTRTYGINCTNSQSGQSDSETVTIYVNNDNNNNNNYNVPNVTISADRTNISNNESTIIRWYPSNANYCNASGGSNGWSGNKSTYSGSFSTGTLSGTTTFYINCTNNSGSDSASVTIYVNNYNNNNNYYVAPAASAPTAVTTAATQISNTSAQLNSLIFTAGSNTNTWFEWGTTANFGNSTNQSGVGSVNSITHSDTITGLSTGVTYYFRAAAENSYLRNYGSTMSFTMQNLGGAVAGASTVINRPTTIINKTGTNSLVMLTIDGGSENIAPGERRNYQVSWKNISNQTLRNVVLRIILPKATTFESSNKGSFSKDDNTITLEIGDLRPNESGDMFLLGTTGLDLQQGQLIVTVANLVYTDASNAQGDALAYATQRADLSGSNLGANALGAGFLPTTFLGWLLLLILLLIILLLSRYLYNQFKSPTQPTPPVAHY